MHEHTQTFTKTQTPAEPHIYAQACSCVEIIKMEIMGQENRMDYTSEGCVAFTLAHLQVVVVFVELFVLLKQTVTASDSSVMLINQYSTAEP